MNPENEPDPLPAPTTTRNRIPRSRATSIARSSRSNSRGSSRTSSHSARASQASSANASRTSSRAASPNRLTQQASEEHSVNERPVASGSGNEVAGPSNGKSKGKKRAREGSEEQLLSLEPHATQRSRTDPKASSSSWARDAGSRDLDDEYYPTMLTFSSEEAYSPHDHSGSASQSWSFPSQIPTQPSQSQQSRSLALDSTSSIPASVTGGEIQDAGPNEAHATGDADERSLGYDPHPTSLSTWVERTESVASNSATAGGSEASGSYLPLGGEEDLARGLSENVLEVIDFTLSSPPPEIHTTQGKDKGKGKGKMNTKSKAKRSSPPPPNNTSNPSQHQVQPTTSMRNLTPPADPLSSYTCPICFFPPTNATLTPCGHICCGECLFTAVKTTQARNAPFAGSYAAAAGGMGPMALWRMAVGGGAAGAGRGAGGDGAMGMGGGAGGPVGMGGGGARAPALCPVCREEIKGWDGKGGGVVGLKVKSIVSI